MERLMEGYTKLIKLKAGDTSTFNVQELSDKCYAAISDDLNSPILIANLFEAIKNINNMVAGTASLTQDDLDAFKHLLKVMIEDILGLNAETGNASEGGNELLESTVNLLLNLRIEAKANKDWATADKIRNELQALGFVIMDTKDGFEWEIK